MIFGEKSGLLDSVNDKRTMKLVLFFCAQKSSFSRSSAGDFCLFSDPLSPLLEGGQRIIHTLSTVDPPKMGVLHSFLPIFGAKVVDKGVVESP